jgi:hypothetical protein
VGSRWTIKTSVFHLVKVWMRDRLFASVVVQASAWSAASTIFAPPVKQIGYSWMENVFAKAGSLISARKKGYRTSSRLECSTRSGRSTKLTLRRG